MPEERSDGGLPEDAVLSLPPEVLRSLEQEVAERGGPWEGSPEDEGCIGWTMFDTPQAKDGVIVALLPGAWVGQVPSRALVRIRSRGDGRQYLGIVQEGPFAEPDGLRADAPVVVTTTVRGHIFMPRYHGRMHIELIAEETAGGPVPPRFRPMPNSPVFLLDAAETGQVLRCQGELRLGHAVGYNDLTIGVPSTRKSVLPRHTGVLGTTGSGKSTTVSRLIYEAQTAGMAVIVLDVEGEYTELHRPTEEPNMVNALRLRGLEPKGVADMHLYHLVGRETTNPDYPRRTEFSLAFERLSPYTVTDILGLSEAQVHRYWQAYDTTKILLRDLGIFPGKFMDEVDREEERRALELNEFEQGYPRMTLSHLLDIATAFHHVVNKDPGDPSLRNAVFQRHLNRVMERIKSVHAENAVSWRALLARLWQLQRLGVFDHAQARSLRYEELLQPGRVSVVDLSDMESTELRNLVIADILRGVQEAQEKRYREAVQKGAPLPRALIVIEEAHEFLSNERIDRMPHLFQQVGRIAKRGRKRWLGLVFVTQHPQHLPDELFGLINNYVLHRINDAGVIGRLRRSIGGIEEGLWARLTALAPGQAIVSFTHMARALLVTVDPTPCKLRMAEE